MEIELYIDGTDLECELGGTAVNFYPTLEELKEHKPCWKECGVVKVKLTVVEWVEERDGN